MAAAPLVDVRDLHVQYPVAPRPQLAGLDLDLQPGRRLLLLGPSGSGKSTLLALLAGVVPQVVDADVTGHLQVCGHDPRATPMAELAARVATLTQDPTDQLCLPTVSDEVAFALENRAVPRDRIGPRVDATLARVGAAHLRDRRTSELSGGEGQRVALAAALVAEPDLLLLDEPTALLDTSAAADVGAVLSDLPGASVLIEHRLDELGRMPERCVVLDAAGQVVATGPTEQVLASEEVAATGSWLPAHVEVGRALGRGVPRDELADGLAAVARAVSPCSDNRGSGSAAGDVTRSRAAGDVVLAARSLRVVRGDRQVVCDVDLQLRAGTITAVIGANGSGKSSLLLGLAGLLPVTGDLVGASGAGRPGRWDRSSASSQVSGGGAPPADAATVGMVFQHPEHQFLARSVVDEVELGMAKADPDWCASVLDRYDLASVAARDPFRLSGGQQRRLSLAAMVVMDDDVLLADEPTFGQDRHTTLAVAAELRDLAAQGRAVVLVSHDLRLVATLADHVVVLAAGRPAAQGPPGDVLTADVLASAGLRLPPLLAAWHGHPADLPGVLQALDVAAASAAPEPALPRSSAPRPHGHDHRVGVQETAR